MGVHGTGPGPDDRSGRSPRAVGRPTRSPALDESDPRRRVVARQIAIAVLKGESNTQIAKSLKISADTVSVYRKSPLFMSMVEAIEERMMAEGVEAVVNDLIRDAPTNVKFIKDVRDGALPDAADRLNVRMRAAEVLLKRQVPQIDENTDRAVQVVISGRLLEQMVRAMRNDGVIESTAETLSLPEPVPQAHMQRVEDFVESYEEPAPVESEEDL